MRKNGYVCLCCHPHTLNCNNFFFKLIFVVTIVIRFHVSNIIKCDAPFPIFDRTFALQISLTNAKNRFETVHFDSVRYKATVQYPYEIAFYIRFSKIVCFAVCTSNKRIKSLIAFAQYKSVTKYDGMLNFVLCEAVNCR